MYNEDVKRNQKGIVFLPILIVVFLLGVVGYFVYQNYSFEQQEPQAQPTPTIDPTSDWKTFSNGNFEYSLKYPADWSTFPSIEEGEMTEPVGLHGASLKGWVVNLYKNYPDLYGPPLLQISAFTNSTLERFEISKTQTCKDSLIETTIDGAAAAVGHRITSDTENQPYSVGHFYCALIFNQNSENLYELIWHEGSFEDSGVFNKILSTFKFTN